MSGRDPTGPEDCPFAGWLAGIEPRRDRGASRTYVVCVGRKRYRAAVAHCLARSGQAFAIRASRLIVNQGYSYPALKPCPQSRYFAANGTFDKQLAVVLK
jgi:hypothetical protein